MRTDQGTVIVDTIFGFEASRQGLTVTRCSRSAAGTLSFIGALDETRRSRIELCGQPTPDENIR